MPKLLLFAACERVILSADQTVSLITIMESVTVGVAANAPKDVTLVAPTVWYATSLWQREDGDADGKHYEQKAELIFEDGTIGVGSEPIEIEFLEGKFNHRGIFQFSGFPLPSESGLADIRLSMRAKSGNGEWQKSASFPVFINRAIFQVPNEIKHS